MVPEKNIDKLAPKPTNPKTGNGIEDIIENLLQQKRLDRSNLAELEQLLRKGEALSFKYDTAKKKFALTQGGLTQYYHRILNPKLNNQLRQG
ncbi:hypothetical protein FACS1894176_07930 [Bacteroidia bacterium]|nr:hypothetical protein FACS1894176_07930 [Bacteroidia bacterium]